MSLYRGRHNDKESRHGQGKQGAEKRSEEAEAGQKARQRSGSYDFDPAAQGLDAVRQRIELSRWTMNDDSSRSPNVDRGRLALLIEQFRRATSATAADRAARAQLLDELQEAVGLSNKMSTETDIIRRAENLLR